MKRLREEAKIPFSIIESSISCPICYEVITEATTLKKCLHRFCGSCLDKFFTTSNTVRNCPVCRCHLPSKREKCPDTNFRGIIEQLTSGSQDKKSKQDNPFNLKASASAHRDRVAQIRREAKKRQEELRRNPPPPPPRFQPKSKRRNDSKQRDKSAVVVYYDHGAEEEEEEDIPFVNLGIKHLVNIQSIPALIFCPYPSIVFYCLSRMDLNCVELPPPVVEVSRWHDRRRMCHCRLAPEVPS
jgi:hypothetical protein